MARANKCVKPGQTYERVPTVVGKHRSSNQRTTKRETRSRSQSASGVRGTLSGTAGKQIRRYPMREQRKCRRTASRDSSICDTLLGAVPAGSFNSKATAFRADVVLDAKRGRTGTTLVLPTLVTWRPKQGSKISYYSHCLPAPYLNYYTYTHDYMVVVSPYLGKNQLRCSVSSTTLGW